MELKIDNKVNKIIDNFDNPYFCKLIFAFIENNEKTVLFGFLAFYINILIFDTCYVIINVKKED